MKLSKAIHNLRFERLEEPMMTGLSSRAKDLEQEIEQVEEYNKMLLTAVDFKKGLAAKNEELVKQITKIRNNFAISRAMDNGYGDCSAKIVDQLDKLLDGMK